MISGFDPIHLHIGDEFHDRGLHVALGVMVYSVGSAGQTDDLRNCIAEEIAAAQSILSGVKPSSLPAVQAARAAFKRLGKDPSRYRPSSEALLRRIASGKDLYRVNDVVDLSNVISIHTQLPVCTYDLNALQAPIVFRRAEAGESYRGIGRDDLNLEGLPVFADNKGPFGTPFSDSDRTKVRAETTQVLSILVSFEGAADLDAELQWSASLLSKHLGLTEMDTFLIRP